jgi:hypothetical protein
LSAGRCAGSRPSGSPGITPPLSPLRVSPSFFFPLHEYLVHRSLLLICGSRACEANLPCLVVRKAQRPAFRHLFKALGFFFIPIRFPLSHPHPSGPGLYVVDHSSALLHSTSYIFVVLSAVRSALDLSCHTSHHTTPHRSRTLHSFTRRPHACTTTASIGGSLCAKSFVCQCRLGIQG